MTDHGPDLELLTRLRAADPASSLPAADAHGVADLLEAVLTDTRVDPESGMRESRETGTHDRSPFTWLVAAAALVLIAGAGILGLSERGQTGSGPVAQPSVTRLGYAPAQGRCLLPGTGVLREQTVAFRGTLVSLVSGTATFDVSRWYAGGPTDTAEVTAAPAPLAELVRDADLTVGHEYLVAASGGDVTGCGVSGPPTRGRLGLYRRAFG